MPYEQQQMKAAVFREVGPVEEKVKVEGVPSPDPSALGATEVIVQVKAAGMNPVNYKIIQGLLGFLTPKLPATDGIDVCGVVVAVGKQCKRLKEGDEVWGKGPAPTRFGTFADYVTLPEEVLTVKPREISFVDGGSLGIAALTSYQALFEIAHVKESEKILIIGGSGGTGTFGIQMAKNVCGAYVATTCSDRNMEFVKSLGADRVINYREEEWGEVLAGEAYDYVYDCRGGPTHWEDAKKVLKPDGHFITIAGDHANQPTITLGSLITTGFQIAGRKLSTLFSGPTYSHLVKLDNGLDRMEKITQWIVEGKVSPVIDSVVLLDNILHAYTRQKSARARGKIVVVMSPDLLPEGAQASLAAPAAAAAPVEQKEAASVAESEESESTAAEVAEKEADAEQFHLSEDAA